MKTTSPALGTPPQQAMNTLPTNTPPSNTESPTLRFRNPLELTGEYNRELHGRIQVDLPKEDLYFFQSINPARGVMQTTINILLVKLQAQLKSHGITNVAQCREYCDFVLNARLTDGREVAGVTNGIASTIPTGSTPSGPMSTPNAPHVVGRKKKSPRKNT